MHDRDRMLMLTLAGGGAGVVAPMASAAGPTCDGRNATIVGDRQGKPNDEVLQIQGTDGPDTIVGTAGIDQIVGFTGDDTICAGGGNDVVEGFAGEDRIFGQGGNDSLVGNDDGDLLVGGRGNDRLRGDGGVDVCNGGKGTDSLFPSHFCEVRKSIEKVP